MHRMHGKLGLVGNMLGWCVHGGGKHTHTDAPWFPCRCSRELSGDGLWPVLGYHISLSMYMYIHQELSIVQLLECFATLILCCCCQHKNSLTAPGRSATELPTPKSAVSVYMDVFTL
jgi:hypothetical protein